MIQKNTMRTLFILIISLLTLGGVNAQNKFGTIVTAVSAGDDAKLAAQFNAQVEIILPGSNKIYTKSQGQMVMKDFFKKNVPSSFSILHEGKRENSQFFIGALKTKNNKTYRLTFLIKESDKHFLIHQIRIQQ